MSTSFEKDLFEVFGAESCDTEEKTGKQKLRKKINDAIQKTYKEEAGIYSTLKHYTTVIPNMQGGGALVVEFRIVPKYKNGVYLEGEVDVDCSVSRTRISANSGVVLSIQEMAEIEERICDIKSTLGKDIVAIRRERKELEKLLNALYTTSEEALASL